MTPAETIRNYIARHGPTRAEICFYASTCHGESIRATAEAIDRLEADGDITRTTTGAYVLGHHPQAAETDLVLVSTDRDFGQARLF